MEVGKEADDPHMARIKVEGACEELKTISEALHKCGVVWGGMFEQLKGLGQMKSSRAHEWKRGIPCSHLLNVRIVELNNGEPEVSVGVVGVQGQRALKGGLGRPQVANLEQASADPHADLRWATRVLAEGAAVPAPGGGE